MLEMYHFNLFFVNRHTHQRDRQPLETIKQQLLAEQQA
jgi:hypothetical protein